MVTNLNFSLIENGVDSLKAAYNSLTEAKYVYEGSEHHFKDATLSLNHANEILFKTLLKEQHEFLIFSDISAYMNAKANMLIGAKSNVFEVKPNLKTINLKEAIMRLSLLCDIEVPKHFIDALEDLTKKRNQIMHYAIKMSQEEYEQFIQKLKDCYELTIHYFSQHFKGLVLMLENARFEFYGDEPDVEAMADEAYLDWLADQDN